MDNHPIVISIGVLASIATIVLTLVTFGVIDVPDGEERGLPASGVAQEDDASDRTPNEEIPCSDPNLSVSDGSGASGTQLAVSGSGFPPDESVKLRFHTESLLPVRTDGAGAFSINVVVPGTFDAFAPGQFDISALTTPTVCSASAVFELTTS